MKTISWYVHGPGGTGSIREYLDDELDGEVEMSEENKEKLVHALRSKFYEVAFDVQIDETTGDIKNVVPTNI